MPLSQKGNFSGGHHSFFKQSFQFFPGLRRQGLRLSMCVAESEEVTEIRTVFIHNPLGLIFSAVIVHAAFIKNTVQTAVKIRTAA